MPITPLHCGLMAPVNHFYPGKVSNTAFIATNLWIDAKAITYVLFGVGSLAHEDSHSLEGAAVIALLVSLFCLFDRRWVLGACYGAFTHVLLDALVHTDVRLLPSWESNPLHVGYLQEISWLLLPFTVWFIFQIASYSLGWLQRVRAGGLLGKSPPDA